MVHYFMDKKNSYNRDEILKCGHGQLFGPGNAQLPLPNMLMFDRISEINDNGGVAGKGLIIAELDLHPDLWFFGCHFEGTRPGTRPGGRKGQIFRTSDTKK
jgi:3-hydroxyacyl-[acyl-carrier protein] dehydratase/trans-2-decenoyl-[acyl-carrier protein] isomerase